MFIERPPCRALAPWVSKVWVAQERMVGQPRWTRERMVPTGSFHLVLRLDDSRIRIFRGLDDSRGQTFNAVVGGARSTFHVREATAGARSLGMLLRPGAAGVVLGVPAEELAERHTGLEEVWGAEARELRERLIEARDPTRQLVLLEKSVLGRLKPRFAAHAAVTEALARFGSETTGWRIGPVRRDFHLSHRRFVQLFRRQVGLGPKQLCRILRLGRAMKLAKGGVSGWAEIAAQAGYCDQSHLARELRAIAGVSPGQWMALATRGQVHHIPVVNFLQDPGSNENAAPHAQISCGVRGRSWRPGWLQTRTR
jgi:AraC-like DNA-binding protein